MRIKFLFISTIFLFLSCVVSCQKNKKNINTSNTALSKKELLYAKGFSIEKFQNFTKLTINSPFQDSEEIFEYYLSSEKKSNVSGTFIKTPVRSIVVTSTTHVSSLELLNAQNKLVGFPNGNYISSIKTRELIDNGSIKELGNEENINTELLLDLDPDLVVGFSITSNNKMFSTIEKIGIPVILNGDWLEESPLGRAEWIKFFGVLLNQEEKADSIFSSIESSYIQAKKIASKSKNKPTLISGGLFKDIWNLPAGDSFEATFLEDANIDYLWKNSTGKGSLSLNIENVFEKGEFADIWISPSFYKTMNELRDANDIYSKFKAFNNNKVYTYVNTTGETGGIIYFEIAPTRPDLVLKDLIKIAHPTLLPNYSLTFFEKLK